MLADLYTIGSSANHTAPSKNDDIFGLVLTGGYSTRMGADKSLLDYHGKPQREFVFELLGKFCAEVFTSCRKDQDVPPNLHPLPDTFEMKGPLNGILSAFSANPQRCWLILAVDMPYVSEDTLRLLVESRDREKLATCFYNEETQQPEPLLTLWEARAYPSLLKFAEAGNPSPREFLKTHPVNMIDPPDKKTLLNFNYPRGL
ncbi:MAG TPA: molybdenum cofactor guanylyltransferase [Chryseosolibacter sp.]